MCVKQEAMRCVDAGEIIAVCSRRLPWDYKDVLPVATCFPHVRDFLFDITPHATANGRVELREVADLHSKISVMRCLAGRRIPLKQHVGFRHSLTEVPWSESDEITPVLQANARHQSLPAFACRRDRLAID